MQVGAGADQEETEDGKGKSDELAGRSSRCVMDIALVGLLMRREMIGRTGRGEEIGS